MSLDALAGGMASTAAAVKFPEIGSMVDGTIVSGSERQQTEYGTGEPITWPNGEPKMEYPIVLDTEDGEVTLYAKNQLWVAVRDAIKAGSPNGLPEVGGRLQVKYIADGEPSKPGFNPPKVYKAKYEPPAKSSIDIDDFD